jgi:hypothetical protein
MIVLNHLQFRDDVMPELEPVQEHTSRVTSCKTNLHSPCPTYLPNNELTQSIHNFVRSVNIDVDDVIRSRTRRFMGISSRAGG